VEALREAGIPPDAVSIFSVDGEAEARRLVANGEYFRYTFYNSPNEAGVGAVDAAVKFLAGSAVPKIIDLQGQGITREVSQN
jgi:ABC-type sugar transport system substrate-binding protein